MFLVRERDVLASPLAEETLLHEGGHFRGVPGRDQVDLWREVQLFRNGTVCERGVEELEAREYRNKQKGGKTTMRARNTQKENDVSPPFSRHTPHGGMTYLTRLPHLVHHHEDVVKLIDLLVVSPQPLPPVERRDHVQNAPSSLRPLVDQILASLGLYWRRVRPAPQLCSALQPADALFVLDRRV